MARSIAGGSRTFPGRGLAGRGPGSAQIAHELLGEREAFGVVFGLHGDAKLERAVEPVVAVGMLHQAYDRARVHLVRFLEQRIAAFAAQVESADSERAR